jgi:hypothetical protein
MTRKWLPAALAAALGLAAFAGYAEEVKLTDQDRTELRQRADDLKTNNRLGRGDDGMRMAQSGHVKHAKGKHAQKHAKKHAKRTT